MDCKKQPRNPVLVHREIPRGEEIYNQTNLRTWCNLFSATRYASDIEDKHIRIYITHPEGNKHEKQKFQILESVCRLMRLLQDCPRCRMEPELPLDCRS